MIARMQKGVVNLGMNKEILEQKLAIIHTVYVIDLITSVFTNLCTCKNMMTLMTLKLDSISYCLLIKGLLNQFIYRMNELYGAPSTCFND
jgi:hypothetical protein